MIPRVQHQKDGTAFLSKVLSSELKNPLLLVGPAGTGRRFSVLEAAKEMVASSDQAYQVDKGIHPDVLVLGVEEDLKVDDVRGWLKATATRPSRSPSKWFILDGIDKVNPATSNALLKSLEEHPSFCQFFLLAERLEGVIPTIQSRCSVVRYKRLPYDFVRSELADRFPSTEDSILNQCARSAQGSLGAALSYAQEGFKDRDTAFSILSDFLRSEYISAFKTIDAQDDLGPVLFQIELALCDLFFLNAAPANVVNQDRTDTLLAWLRSRSKSTTFSTLRESLRLLQSRASWSLNHKFHLKAALANAT